MSEPIAYNLREAAKVTGVSADTLTRAIHAGKLDAVQTGKERGKTLVTPDALRAWVKGLRRA